MRNKQLREKVYESLSSVLPITAIVLILCITITPVEPGILILFIFGALMLILGMGLFTLGVDMSMIPMGDGIGVQMSKSKRMVFPLLLAFVLGFIITIAEPDLQVLADKFPAVENHVLILSVAVGVGLFLLIAVLRLYFKIPLNYLLIFFYACVFILAFFSSSDFIPVSFDSGGVTTGPITVPFIMAFGIGMASLSSNKNSSSDSFGMVALCSIGPIIAVLILGKFYEPSANTEILEIGEILTTKDAFRYFVTALPEYLKEVILAISPIAVVFLLFQLFTRRFKKMQIKKIITGFVLTFAGLVLFLTGANIGFMPAGQIIGGALATGNTKYLLIPVGMVIGYYIVSAEPAVHVLKKQVEEISNGSITQKSIGRALSLGVAASVGISMLRILTGVSIMWFLIPGYALSLIISFFVPKIYTGIAFDSGGVASGTMATTFLLPFAMGACTALGGNILTDAFGSVAMVAMTPLITIQLLGFRSTMKNKSAVKNREKIASTIPDCVVYFEN